MMRLEASKETLLAVAEEFNNVTQSTTNKKEDEVDNIEDDRQKHTTRTDRVQHDEEDHKGKIRTTEAPATSLMSSIQSGICSVNLDQMEVEFDEELLQKKLDEMLKRAAEIRDAGSS
ncbi:unnamed protein product, partial [Amoebophrya sp. A25]|eukprot:GSA25T00018565001.1